MQTDLTALIERVESGTGRDERVDWEILCLIDPRAERSGALPGDPRYTTSLDAVLSLIEAKLPDITDSSPADFLAACIDEMMTRGWRPDEPNGPQICRAALASLLRALQESRRHD